MDYGGSGSLDPQSLTLCFFFTCHRLVVKSKKKHMEYMTANSQFGLIDTCVVLSHNAEFAALVL
jgi:hypothetical protein